MPFAININSDMSAICRGCVDSIIPTGSKILSINGRSIEAMIDDMLPYVSGERKPFKISRINSSFPALFTMLYPTDRYEVVYLSENGTKPLSATLEGVTYADFLKRYPRKKRNDSTAPYSFSIDKEKNVAVMDFKMFVDTKGMKNFADSMFRTLAEENIGNLIIDIRDNGGGNSLVGDVLLQYLSPEPFTQMEKTLVRVTPLTRELSGNHDMDLMFEFFTVTPDRYNKPLTKEEGHYDGNVYLLTSNNTFSSAASFAWTFRESGAGTVVGEETGGMNVSYGDILPFHLPVSELICTISFKRFWQWHADEKDIHGTIPHFSVPAAEALDKALSIIAGQSKKE